MGNVQGSRKCVLNSLRQYLSSIRILIYFHVVMLSDYQIIFYFSLDVVAAMLLGTEESGAICKSEKNIDR